MKNVRTLNPKNVDIKKNMIFMNDSSFSILDNFDIKAIQHKETETLNIDMIKV